MANLNPSSSQDALNENARRRQELNGEKALSFPLLIAERFVGCEDVGYEVVVKGLHLCKVSGVGVTICSLEVKGGLCQLPVQFSYELDSVEGARRHCHKLYPPSAELA